MSGPACGSEEHNEARRREVIFLKKAYQLQAVNKVNSRQPNFDKEQCNCPQYSCCIQRKKDDALYGKYSFDGLTPEEARRLAEYEKQIRKPREAYTAKLPFRFNNYDYLSQR